MKKTIFYLTVLFVLGSCSPRTGSYSNAPTYNPSPQPGQSQPPAQVGYNQQTPPPPPATLNYDQPTYQTFYDELSPYGYWTNYQSYGYVWVPSLGPSFRPYYTNGNWAYTDNGWTWASNYPWGWAPFHYGNWLYDNFYGWVWVPGYQWAPAWVTWGSYGGNYGWAPVQPGVVITSGYNPPQAYWTFVPAQHIAERNVTTYVVDNNGFYNNVTVINNQGNYNNVNYYTGPHREDVERASGNRVNTVQVVDSRTPQMNGNNENQISVYRPAINRSDNVHQVPSSIVPIEQLKEKNSTEVKPIPRNNNIPNSNGANNSNNIKGNDTKVNNPVPQVQQQSVPVQKPTINQNNPNNNSKPSIQNNAVQKGNSPATHPQKQNSQPNKQVKKPKQNKAQQKPPVQNPPEKH